MRVLVIVNPNSGGSEAGLYDFARSLGTSGAEVVMRFTSPQTRIEHLLEDAGCFDRVVAAGGDGTVSAVAYATRHSGIPILAYPAGTANLLALNLGLPLDAPQLAHITLEGVPVAFDLGQIKHPEPDGSVSHSGFAIMAGAGYDAAIMETAQPWKSTFGAAAYLMAAASNVAPQVATFQLTLDGTEIETDGIAVLLVNFGRIQFDLTITHEWDPQDGMLDVVVLRTKNVAGLLPVVFTAMFDRLGESRDRIGVETYRARNVVIDSQPKLRVQYDGEALEKTTPVTARTLKRAATLLVPQGSAYTRTAGPTSG